MTIKEYLRAHKGTAPRAEVVQGCMIELGASKKSVDNAWAAVPEVCDARPVATNPTGSVPGALKVDDYCKGYDLPSLVLGAIGDIRAAGGEVIGDADMRKYCAELGGKPIAERNWKNVHNSSRVKSYLWKSPANHSIIWGISPKVLEEVRMRQGYHFE